MQLIPCVDAISDPTAASLQISQPTSDPQTLPFAAPLTTVTPEKRT